MSHGSLMPESLGLDLSDAAHSAAGLSAGREENVNYMLDLSDDEVSIIVISVLLSINIADVSTYLTDLSASVLGRSVGRWSVGRSEKCIRLVREKKLIIFPYR